jgi:glycosyltransferase involved in cell wall biosynthesis
LVLKLLAFFRREKVDVVHTHSLDPMLYGGLAAWLAQVPVRIHTQHNTLLRNFGLKDRIKFRIAARLFNRIVAVSDETNRVLQMYGVPASRRITILNSIDEGRYAPTASHFSRQTRSERRDRTVVRIGVVARLAPEKGIPVLLEAFAPLAHERPDLQLVIVGDGRERGELERLAQRLHIEHAVEFLGYQDAVESILVTFDLFVLPSLTEGIPLALLEAMGAGLPAVATAVGGVPEVIENGVSGVLVPPNDPLALRTAISSLLEHPDDRARIGANAVRRVQEKFGLAAAAAAYWDVYGLE